MNNTHVHPLMAAVLHSVATAPMQAREIQRGAYVAMLKRCDWTAEFSDSVDVRRQGDAALRELRMLQRELDPDFTLWNQHAPSRCRNGAAYA